MNFFVAERGGFEPPKGFKTLTGLANQRTRPLCDLSKYLNILPKNPHLVNCDKIKT